MNTTMNYIMSLQLAIYLNVVVFFRGVAQSLGIILQASAEDSCESIGCQTNDIESDQVGCAKKGGLNCAYYVCSDDVDWDATCDLVNATYPNYHLTGFVMIGGATWSATRFDKQSGSYSFDYAKDNSSFELIVNMIFNGKSEATTSVLCQLVQACNFTMALFDRNCKGRLVGRDYFQGQFQDLIEDFEVDTITDTSGEFDGTPSDSITWSGTGEKPPLFLAMNKNEFEQTYI